jgi:hypothetical protein
MITCLIDNTAQSVAEILCSQCGTRVDTGRIFCANCGAALRAPAPLSRPGSQDINPSAMSSMKRIIVTVIKYLAGLSAVVFWVCPLRTGTQVLVFVTSIAVLLICHSVLSDMDEAYAAKNTGYWPKPPDWSAPAKSDNSSAKPTAPYTKI